MLLLLPLLHAMKWWHQMPWSSFFKRWVLSQPFHSPLSSSSSSSLVSLCFLPLSWYHLPIWGYWYFSQKSWFQLVIHPSSLEFCMIYCAQKLIEQDDNIGGRSPDGGGIGRGDHALSCKFIKRITERRANFTKQLLIASWGHQTPRKATHSLLKEVGQNIKDKKRDKRAKDGDPSQEGSLALAGLGEVFESRRATWLGGEQ